MYLSRPLLKLSVPLVITTCCNKVRGLKNVSHTVNSSSHERPLWLSKHIFVSVITVVLCNIIYIQDFWHYFAPLVLNWFYNVVMGNCLSFCMMHLSLYFYQGWQLDVKFCSYNEMQSHFIIVRGKISKVNYFPLRVFPVDIKKLQDNCLR